MKIIKIILLMLLITTSIIIANNNRWQIISTMPIPVAGGVAVTYENKIYILGGNSDDSFLSLNVIQIFDPRTNQWEVDWIMQHRRGDLFAISTNNGIFYGGGTNYPDTNSSLEFFSIPKKITIYDKNNVFARNYASVIIKDNSLFLIGGDRLVDTNFISEYNLTTKRVTNFFEGFYKKNKLLGMMTGMLDDNIYILGGSKEFISRIISKVNLDLKNTVYEYSTLLEPRAFGASVTLEEQERIYLIGGLNELKNCLRSVEIVSFFQNNVFSEFGNKLNVGRYDLMATKYDNRIYVFGGYNNNGRIESSVEMLQLGPTSIELNNNNIQARIFTQQNYPNPFNPKTTIKYSISELSKAKVTIRVYDSLGKVITTLVNKEQSAGTYIVNFDASQFNLASGIYYYSVMRNNYLKTYKMVLIK